MGIIASGIAAVVAMGVVGCSAHKNRQPAHLVEVVPPAGARMAVVNLSHYADPKTGCIAILFDTQKTSVCPDGGSNTTP